MTISTELTALQQDITNARTAITNMGGAVTTSGGSSQLAMDIATIPIAFIVINSIIGATLTCDSQTYTLTGTEASHAFPVTLGTHTCSASIMGYETVTETVVITQGTIYSTTLNPILPLPSTYQEVEYLQSTGTQYINTNIYPISDYSYELSFTGYSIPTENQENVMFGTTSNSWGETIGVNQSKFGDRSNVIPYIRYDGVDCPLKQKSEGTFLLTRYDFYYNNTVYFTPDTPPSFGIQSFPIYLFCINKSGTPSRQANGVSSTLPIFKCSSFKIWNSSTLTTNNLICNLVPCYRKSDNKPGMYDTITQTFLINQGTDTDFIAGPDVN